MGAPEPDQLEISLFGPGRGECVVVHLGRNEWMIVDSCLAPSGEPIALKYLSSIGVDPAKAVRLIVASHWHDDHIEGLAKVVAECGVAKFACSAALDSKEFYALVSVFRTVRGVCHTTGSEEFGRILSESRRNGPDAWAAANTKLYENLATAPAPVIVESLSPSAFTQTVAAATLAELLPKAGQPFRRIPNITPNKLSAVLRVTFGQCSFLLGGDLEVGGAQPLVGWNAILGSQFAFAKSGAYKVAHHAADNAHSDQIWTTLLTQDSHSMIAPYSSLERPRPRDEDKDRLLGLTANVYCTKWPVVRGPKKRSKSVDRTIANTAIQMGAVDRTPGHIQLRLKHDATGPAWSVVLSDGAVKF